MTGSDIKKARKATGLTQEELATKCKISVMTIRRYESGKRQPRLETVMAIKKALGIDEMDLLAQAIDDIRLLARMEFACPVCAYYNHGEGKKGECVKCLTGDGFRWRGEKEEEK